MENDLQRDMYRDLVESSPDGVWVFDLEARTRFVNPRLAEMYGASREEMSGVTVFDTLDDDGKVQFEEHLRALRQGRFNTSPVECLFHDKAGTPHWMFVQESPYTGPDGEVIGAVQRYTEFTQRREMGLALAESRAQLAEAQRIARVGSFHWDRESDAISLSVQLAEMLDVHDARPTYETFLGFVHPEDRDALDATVQQALSTGERFTFLTRVGSDERGWVWVRGRGECRRDPGGAVAALEGTLQDVTTSVEQEEALRDQVEQNSLMHAVATAANQASTLDDLLGQSKHLVLLHDDWCRARGFRVADEELAPIYLEDADRLEDESDPTRMAADLELARRVVESRDLVWDDSKLTIAFPVMRREELLAVLMIESKPPLYRYSMIEEFVRQVAAHMQQVALREEATQQIQEARDAAMTASRQKSDFLAMVSHEIRTPLNGVIGLNELLLQTSLDEEQRKLATGAGLSGRLLLNLINDILDFSKIEAGRLKLEHLDFDVRETLEQIVAAHRENAGAKGVGLEVCVEDRVPEVLCGDPTRLAQVVNNLVSNAVKFTDDGCVRVRVSAQPDGAGWVLRCEVSDTGIGIDSDTADLFEPFRQADTSTSRRFGGTGLGLAISKELVELTGGEIGYESTPGAGSTFWFTVHLEHPAHHAVVGRPMSPTLQVHGVARRILVVEDNPLNRMVATGILRALGHEVETAEDGLVALQRLRESFYDLVLLDVQMPRLDGYGTARAIRETERQSDMGRTPVIALTAAAVEGERERCLQAGMDDFLTKPIDPAMLSLSLRRWLGDAPTERAHPTSGRPVKEVPMPQADDDTVVDMPVLDLARVRMLRDLVPGDTSYLDRVVDNFMVKSREAEKTLWQALRSGDAEQLRFHAHSLKGSAANIGLTRVAEVAELLQRLGGAGDVEDGEVLLRHLATLLEDGREALRAQRESAYAEPAPAWSTA